MRDIAQKLLLFIQETKQSYKGSEDSHCWEGYSFPDAVSEFVRYVYEGGIWDGDFREKLDRLKNADIEKLELQDVYSYFTAIVCIERCFRGFVEQNTYNGTLEKLLERYLELTQ